MWGGGGQIFGQKDPEHIRQIAETARNKQDMIFGFIERGTENGDDLGGEVPVERELGGKSARD